MATTIQDIRAILSRVINPDTRKTLAVTEPELRIAASGDAFDITVTLGYPLFNGEQALGTAIRPALDAAGARLGKLEFQSRIVAHAVQRELRGHGLHTIVADADGDPAEELELAARLAAQRVDGLLVAPIGPAGGDWTKLTARTPTVTIAGRLPGAELAGEVAFDQTAGVGEVLRHLSALGHRRIAVLSWAVTTSPDRPTERAVREQSAALGLDCELVPCAYSLDGSRPLALEVLERPDRPTALFCLSDSIAYGALHGCRELGLSVPGDISLVGFDDHPLSRLIAPPLTSVNWSIDRTARAAVGFLVDHLAGEPGERRTVIAPSLVVRDSSGPAPG